ncbi:MAG: hypothetical protein PWP65_214 [Clostridia bacterium]|nr:hypothetical protein [Clostridia bacterium]
MSPRLLLGLIYLSLGLIIFGLINDISLKREKPVLSPSPEVILLPSFQEIFDVLVMGAEPEGVAAAISAARSGVRVLLLDPHEKPGGLFTYGMLNVLDMNFGPRGELLTKGIFEEFFRQIKGEAFDVEHAARVLTDLIKRESNLTFLPLATFMRPEMDVLGKTIIGLRVKHDSLEKSFFGKIIIDATQDADVAAAAGVPYTLGGSDYGLKEKMAATLILHIGGVNWQVFTQGLRHSREPTTGFNKVTAWGYGEVMHQYRPKHPQIYVRGLNVGLQHDGSVLINCMLIFLPDYLDPAARLKALQIGQAEAPLLVEYMKKRIPGFERAYLIGTAPELYIRETRHIMGEYRLTINDVLGNKMFADRIALGSYPVDVQATAPGKYGVVYGKPAVYSIPYRCLVPLKIDNLLVVGRSASYTSLAAGSARVVPIGMAVGQAAGVAAAYCIRKGLTPRQLAYNLADIQQVQKELIRQGAYLEEYNIPEAISTHWAYEYLKFFRSLGLAAGGYHNRWHLDEPISVKPFIHLIEMAAVRSGIIEQKEIRKVFEPIEASISISSAPLSREQALRILASLHKEVPEKTSGEDLFRYFCEKGWLSPTVQKQLQGKNLVSRGLAYALIYDTLNKIRNQQISRGEAG